MTTEAGYVAAWASGPHLHDKDLDLTIDAAHVLRHDSLRPYDLDSGVTFYAVGMPRG